MVIQFMVNLIGAMIGALIVTGLFCGAIAVAVIICNPAGYRAPHPRPLSTRGRGEEDAAE